jgi:hypothetical protein
MSNLEFEHEWVSSTTTNLISWAKLTLRNTTEFNGVDKQAPSKATPNASFILTK